MLGVRGWCLLNSAELCSTGGFWAGGGGPTHVWGELRRLKVWKGVVAANQGFALPWCQSSGTVLRAGDWVWFFFHFQQKTPAWKNRCSVEDFRRTSPCPQEMLDKQDSGVQLPWEGALASLLLSLSWNNLMVPALNQGLRI